MPEPSSRLRARRPIVIALGSAGRFSERERQSLLGAKGADLDRWCRAGLPVPPGFVVTTAARRHPAPSLLRAVNGELARLERRSRHPPGNAKHPPALILRCSPPTGVASPAPAVRDVAARSHAEARTLVGREIRRLLRLDGVPVAVIVQAMAPGEVRQAYTRDPESGDDRLVLDDGGPVPAGLLALKRKLERCCGDIQAFEFAVVDGAPMLLGSRTPSRTTRAAVRIAADLVRAGTITPREAVLRVDPAGVERLLHAGFAPKASNRPLEVGIGAAPGAAVGKPAFTADEALARARAGEQVILVRTETEPADIPAMKRCAGVLTGSGGLTSHAAVVARGWGICCVVGVGGMQVEPRRRRVTIAGTPFGQEDWLSIDGVSGAVYGGALPVVPPRLDRDLRTLLEYADRFRRLRVRANVDTSRDARVARRLGAEGIGLCRTEHMFFDEHRLGYMRAMIVADDDASRRAALDKLLPLQRADFIGLFTAMRGRPVTIRLLDPPLHEFLPTRESEIRAVSRSIGVPVSRVRRRLSQLREVNPMLGHRGDRLAITCPDLLEMQVRAILEAACQCATRGVPVRPEILVPLVGSRAELDFCRQVTDAVARRVMRERSVRVDYRFGTMIEVPRAALVAGELASSADFFSFGTNDLTQLTFGYSRDDAGSFLPAFLDRGILPDDPFRRLDEAGVGALMKLAVELGRGVRPDLQCGLCGEHGGDSHSVRFCHDLGLDYVSCSAYRIPVARLAAAHAALKSANPGVSRATRR